MIIRHLYYQGTRYYLARLDYYYRARGTHPHSNTQQHTAIHIHVVLSLSLAQPFSHLLHSQGFATNWEKLSHTWIPLHSHTTTPPTHYTSRAQRGPAGSKPAIKWHRHTAINSTVLLRHLLAITSLGTYVLRCRRRGAWWLAHTPLESAMSQQNVYITYRVLEFSKRWAGLRL